VSAEVVGEVRPSIAAADIDLRWVRVWWDDGTVSRYHHLWLRDNCPQLRHPATGHRTIDTAQIPEDCRPSAVEVAAGDDLRVTWAHDGHVSSYPAAWLAANDYSNGARNTRPVPVLWEAADVDAIPRAAHPDIVADATARRRFLTGFVRYGLGLLGDVPCVPGTVLDVAALFGQVRTTSWGKVFDVRSMVDANSLAYTNLPLVTHTDEAYRDPVPTVQLQHVLRADASGGESTLVDGFRLATDLRHEHPEAFRRLASTVLRFRFADATNELDCDAPVIDSFPDGELRAIRFSNHSATPFLIPFDEMEPFYAAYRTFGAMRESARYQLRITMGPGEVYMVDNRRVLHGRTGFSAGGARHLQSCYIERDELVSRLSVLSRP
jgi:[2-(trimethylamino)ethyl]phosphonate dioxygenase